jgi:hypothetical protein
MTGTIVVELTREELDVLRMVVAEAARKAAKGTTGHDCRGRRDCRCRDCLRRAQHVHRVLCAECRRTLALARAEEALRRAEGEVRL